MNRLGICFVWPTLLGRISSSTASFRPSFALEDSAWNAKDIAVVATTGQDPGRAKVLEAWKGDLQRGEFVDAPKLEAFVSESVRTVVTSSWYAPTPTAPQPVARVTGVKTVLFLKRGPGPFEDWQPANERLVRRQSVGPTGR